MKTIHLSAILNVINLPCYSAGFFVCLLSNRKTPVYLTLLNSLFLCCLKSICYKGVLLLLVKVLFSLLNNLRKLALSGFLFTIYIYDLQICMPQPLNFAPHEK